MVLRFSEDALDKLVSVILQKGMIGPDGRGAKCLLHQPSLTAGLVTIASECDLFG